MSSLLKRNALALALVVLAVTLAPVSGALADNIHRISIHVSDNSKLTQNLALNYLENAVKYYKGKGKKVEVRVVANGPGLHMFRADKSKVKSRIERISLALDNVSFAGCGVTRSKMAKQEGKDIPILPEVTMVPGGVIELVELQKKGWAYIKP